MIVRLTPATLIRDLIRRIADAIRRKDIGALQELRQKLLLVRIEQTRAAELSQLFRPVRTRLEAAIGGLSLDSISRVIEKIDNAIRELIQSVREWFESAIFSESSQQRKESSEWLIGLLAASQLRRITGLPIDNAGAIKPPPGRLPTNLQDESMSLREILMRLSPLIVIPGDKSQEERTPIADLVLPGFTDRASIIGDLASSTPAVSRHWSIKLDYWTRTFEELSAKLSAGALNNREPRLLLSDMRAELTAIQDNLLLEFRHESQRIRGRIDDELSTRLPEDVYAGYTLHSRFAHNTAPDHAARDGWRFFRDNRPGSATPWSERLIPPYRRRCICFTIPILETPEGEVYDSEFGLRVSGTQLISIRDVGTWQTWFDQQQPWVHKKLVGERRWFAAASTGNGKPTWSDFVRPDGSIMPVRRLLDESVIERQRRKERVRIIIEEQSKRHFEAWERGDGRFDSTPEVEAAYRKRLDVFLRRWLA